MFSLFGIAPTLSALEIKASSESWLTLATSAALTESGARNSSRCSASAVSSLCSNSSLSSQRTLASSRIALAAAWPSPINALCFASRFTLSEASVVATTLAATSAARSGVSKSSINMRALSAPRRSLMAHAWDCGSCSVIVYASYVLVAGKARPFTYIPTCIHSWPRFPLLNNHTMPFIALTNSPENKRLLVAVLEGGVPPSGGDTVQHFVGVQVYQVLFVNAGRVNAVNRFLRWLGAYPHHPVCGINRSHNPPPLAGYRSRGRSSSSSINAPSSWITCSTTPSGRPTSSLIKAAPRPY